MPWRLRTRAIQTETRPSSMVTEQGLRATLLCAPYLKAPSKFFGHSRECRLAQGLFKRLKYYKYSILPHFCQLSFQMDGERLIGLGNDFASSEALSETRRVDSFLRPCPFSPSLRAVGSTLRPVSPTVRRVALRGGARAGLRLVEPTPRREAGTESSRKPGRWQGDMSKKPSRMRVHVIPYPSHALQLFLAKSP